MNDPDLFCDYFEKVHHGEMNRGNSINLKLPKVKLEDFRSGKVLIFRAPYCETIFILRSGFSCRSQIDSRFH